MNTAPDLIDIVGVILVVGVGVVLLRGVWLFVTSVAAEYFETHSTANERSSQGTGSTKPVVTADRQQTTEHASDRNPTPASGLLSEMASPTDGHHEAPSQTQVADTAPARPVTNVPLPNEPARIFICYRREDTQGEAGRLYDRLTDTFGASQVFMDIDSVPLGIDFVDRVKEQISNCRAVIVMIGRQWLTIPDKRGNRRLDDSEDLVRVEIAAALKQHVPVIPVLVQNASIPDREDLPDDLRLLTRRNGIALRHDQWREGVERLLKELDPTMGRNR
jgi:hypothetical protein